ncbi:MAG: efflux RND transporter periplasmic adaptor subunit [Ginsengibacter sp.]
MKSNHIFMKPVLFLFLAVAMFVACKNNTKSREITTTTSNAIDTVPVFILHDTSVAKNIELPAELLPYEQSELFARVQGYVKEMKVDIGDKVHRGQILALIEAPELNTKQAEYQSAVQAAKAKYLSSNDMYQRLNKASQAKTPGIVAPVELIRSHNQLLADSASYQASRQLAQSYEQVAGLLLLRSPFDGIITTRNADRGALVGNSQVVLTVQNNRTLRLRIAVPELYNASNTATTQATFRLDAFPEKLFAATLSRKSGTIDPTTRTEQWEYSFDNKADDLKAGSFAYVELNMERKGTSFVIAPGSIATNQERKFVIKVKDGKAEWVDVRQGMSTDKGIEVFGILSNGDTLVVRATDERKPASTAYWKMVK